MQISHGSVLMMLADITAGSGVNFSVGKTSGSPTISLSLDLFRMLMSIRGLSRDLSWCPFANVLGFVLERSYLKTI